MLINHMSREIRHKDTPYYMEICLPFIGTYLDKGNANGKFRTLRVREMTTEYSVCCPIPPTTVQNVM